jgi:hypothetical protein
VAVDDSEKSNARLDHPMDVVRLRSARTALRNGNEGGQCHNSIENTKPELPARTVTRNGGSGFFVGFIKRKKASETWQSLKPVIRGA